MTVGVVHPRVVRTQRFVQNTRRIGNNAPAVHGNTPIRADENRAAIIADLLAWVLCRVDHDTIGITIVDGATVIGYLDEGGGVGIDRPLNDVVMMRTPVDIAHNDTRELLAGLAGIRAPGGRPKPEIPIEPLGHRNALVRGPMVGPKRAWQAIGINLLELADAAL